MNGGEREFLLVLTATLRVRLDPADPRYAGLAKGATGLEDIILAAVDAAQLAPDFPCGAWQTSTVVTPTRDHTPADDTVRIHPWDATDDPGEALEWEYVDGDDG